MMNKFTGYLPTLPTCFDRLSSLKGLRVMGETNLADLANGSARICARTCPFQYRLSMLVRLENTNKITSLSVANLKSWVV